MIYGLFDFLGKAGAIILVPLYAKMLGPSEYGMLELLTVTGSLLLITSVLGFNSALTRYYVTEKNEREQNKIFQTAFFTVITVAAVLIVILILSAPVISRVVFGSPQYALYWRILFVTVLSDATAAILLALFRSQTKAGLYSTINFSKLVLTLGLNVLFVGFLKEGVFGVLIGNLLGSVSGLSLGLIFSVRYIRVRFSRKYLILLARFGLPLVVSGFGFFVINSADRYFLKAYAGLADLGAYALGYKIGMLMSLAVNAFVVAWPPLMFRIVDDPGAKRTFATVLSYYLLVSCAILEIIGSFSHEIVRIIGTPAYSAAGGIVIFILASYLFQGAYYIMSTGITVTDHTKLIPVIVGISAAINLAADLLLIPRFGIMGAAVATITSYAFLPIGMYFASQHYYPIRFEGGRVLRIVVPTLVILGLNMWLLRGDSVISILAKVMIALSYPFLLLALGFFTNEEIRRSKTMLTKLIRKAIP